MSGTEIMEKIEEQTEGYWKPSPGSIYPLLAWLKKNSYTEEASPQETGMKRYTLTEKGKEFLERHVREKEQLEKKLDFAFPLFTNILLADQREELKKSSMRFMKALLNLRKLFKRNYSDQSTTELAKFLESTSEEIEEITRKLESETSMETN
jgi:DNA-binding PadR family transcriptional regulator